MAFEATHVRFALALADVLGADDRGTLISGAAYPDSRYVTRLPRHATHDEDALGRGETSFEKGWRSHLAYDRLLKAEYLRGTRLADEPILPLSPAWVGMTAAKLVEDGFAWDALGPEAALLRTIAAPAAPPRGEGSEALERYYSLLRSLYAKKPSPADYAGLFDAFGVPEAVAREVVAQAEAILKDATRRREIEKLYDTAVEGWGAEAGEAGANGPRA